MLRYIYVEMEKRRRFMLITKKVGALINRVFGKPPALHGQVVLETPEKSEAEDDMR